MFRYIFSLIAAGLITVVIFFLMMALIKFTYIPNDPVEKLVANFQLIDFQELEDDEAPRKKLILEKTLSPPSSSAGNPPSSATTLSSLPPIPRIVLVSSLVDDINFDISIPSPNFRNGKNYKRASGYNNGAGSNVGLGDSIGGGKACTIGFSLDQNGKINELQWYNCMGKQISDQAEAKLYTWVHENPDEIDQLGAKPGEEIFITFDN